jgi:hypothetical protein
LKPLSLRAWPARTLTAASIALAAGGAPAQSTTEAALAARLDQLASELAAVKAQLAELQQQRAAPAAVPVPVTAVAARAPTAVPAPPAEVAASAQAGATQPATALGGYVEINYSRPTSDPANTQADLARFVLGYQHRFDEKTKVVTELEVEHAVSSADDAGEVEIEQAYVEHQFTPTWAGQAGLFLMPIGLLNGNHEPTAYYGVFRNFVETAIIPTTWREGGLQAIASFDNGITLQLGISTGFDLSTWDATSGEGQESPLGSIHQELSLARAADLSGFGALNWRGVPGLQLGGSIFGGGASQRQLGTRSNVTLWEVHGRYQPGRWDLAALYSRGTISNTAALNQPLVGNPTLIPASFDGSYVVAAYKLWSDPDYALWPFLRLEQYNTAKSYADLGPGLTPDAAPDERVATLGVNFNIGSGVVLKADAQRFRVKTDMNRINLGLGWNF